MASIYATTKGFNELWHKVTQERETLDKYKKKIPPFIIDNNVALTYTLGIEYYSEILAELNTIKNEEMEDWVIDVFPSLYAGIDSLISDMKSLLANYESELKKNKVIPSEKTADRKPETPPATQQESNPIMPPAVVPTNTDTTPAGSSSQPAGNTNTQAGGSSQTDTSTQQDKATQKENKPALKEEGKPKNDLFTPTNILLILLVVGGGIFFMTRKGK